MDTNLAFEEEIMEELINGQIVLMSPSPTFNHNQIASNIYRIFANYLDDKPCNAIADGTKLFLSETNRFIPDMMIVCDRKKIRHDGVHGTPDFVLEVLSPGTAKNDKGPKKEMYALYGVKEYWLVEPSNQSIEQYILENNQLILHDIYFIYPDYMLAVMTEKERANVITEFKCSLYNDLTIKLEDIFKRTI